MTTPRQITNAARHGLRMALIVICVLLAAVGAFLLFVVVSK